MTLKQFKKKKPPPNVGFDILNDRYLLNVNFSSLNKKRFCIIFSVKNGLNLSFTNAIFVILCA